MWANSARLSAVYQYTGEAQNIARIVPKLPKFPGMIKMLDLGGDAGFYAMAIANAHPLMHAFILEQPAVAAVAQEFVHEYETSDRVTVFSVNYLTNDLGDSYELIFAGSTLNFCNKNFKPLFEKIYKTLKPGGAFMTHQDGLTDERTKPVYHVTEFLSAELMEMDFGIEQGEIAQTMLNVGFKSVQSFTKHSDIGPMDIDIARK